VISRVADHCFWFGRYLERAESSSRLLQATRALVFDADIPVTQCWAPLVIVSGERDPFVERHGVSALGDGELVQEYLTWSDDSRVSLRSSVRYARQSARAIRDQLSLDVWEEVNALYHLLGKPEARRLYREDREELYKSVRRSTQLALGLVRSTMLHEEPMSFLWAGVMLERTIQIARTLDMHHHTMQRESAHAVVEVALWLSLVRACSSYDAYLRIAQGRVNAQGIVEFLLLSPDFPRSLRYCLRAAYGLLRRIWSHKSDDPAQHASLAQLGALLDWLDALEDGLDLARIHGLLTHVVDETSKVCSSVIREIQGPELPSSETTMVQTQEG
jgi:uncharacterized alpha-E superfamily protein